MDTMSAIGSLRGPRVRILDMEFDRLTVAEAADEMEAYVRDGTPRRIACVNVALYVWARSAPRLWHYYSSCDLLIADGMGLYYASRILGDPTPGITNAVFLMHELLERAARNSYRVYVLGTRPEILERAIARMRRDYPGLQIVGSRDGFFERELEGPIVAEIKSKQPDILLIGMSSVRKDEFLERNLSALDVPVCLGVGGALDVVAGAYRLAPQWVRRTGFEWLYRLIQEPRRLWRRYLTTNTVFAWLLLAAAGRRLLPPLERRL